MISLLPRNAKKQEIETEQRKKAEWVSNLTGKQKNQENRANN